MTKMPTLEALYRPVRPELDRVRDRVQGLWTDALALVNGPSPVPAKTGGKLLRPALCLLSAGAAGAGDVGEFVPLATALELLHIAALTHDDVVDKAALRRGAASLNALWDDRTAVLSGDYLVARSIELLAEFGSCPVIASTFSAVRQMTEGELGSLARRGSDFAEEDCLRLAEQKTASYFAVTCSAPTYAIGDTHRDALHGYGLALGIAFQIVDDILDITQQEQALGKPSCGDVVEGKGTLPLLYLSQLLPEGDRERFQSMIGKPITDEQRTWLVANLESTGARGKAEAVAQSYAARACAALKGLPAGPYRESMEGLTRFILVRGA